MAEFFTTLIHSLMASLKIFVTMTESDEPGEPQTNSAVFVAPIQFQRHLLPECATVSGLMLSYIIRFY